MSIKPVAWMKNAKQGQHTSLIFTGFETEGFEPLIPAIPDTHRVVSVELLHAIEIDMAMECTNFDTLTKLRAIIEDKT